MKTTALRHSSKAVLIGRAFVQFLEANGLDWMRFFKLAAIDGAHPKLVSTAIAVGWAKIGLIFFPLFPTHIKAAACLKSVSWCCGWTKLSWQKEGMQPTRHYVFRGIYRLLLVWLSIANRRRWGWWWWWWRCLRFARYFFFLAMQQLLLIEWMENQSTKT